MLVIPRLSIGFIALKIAYNSIRRLEPTWLSVSPLWSISSNTKRNISGSWRLLIRKINISLSKSINIAPMRSSARFTIILTHVWPWWTIWDIIPYNSKVSGLYLVNFFTINLRFGSVHMFVFTNRFVGENGGCVFSGSVFWGLSWVLMSTKKVSLSNQRNIRSSDETPSWHLPCKTDAQDIIFGLQET